MKKYIFLFVIFLLLLLLPFYPAIREENTTKTTIFTYEIINRYPHDIEAFTQGFIYKDGYFYESTGLRGQSSLRKVEPGTGEIKQIHYLPEKYFAEGITIFEDKIYQLTWEEETGFIYDLDFNLLDKFNYNGEGWGLTNDGEYLIMSNGTSNLYFLDPKTREQKRQLKVTLNKENPEYITDYINELQYVHGKIYANVWYEDYILIINPGNGSVEGIIELEGILDSDDYDHQINVLNGIAHDKENDRLFVTGKLWPYIFEIEIKPLH